MQLQNKNNAMKKMSISVMISVLFNKSGRCGAGQKGGE
jgi:hypothetical protein